MTDTEFTSKAHILLVDDSEQNRYIVARILRYAGFKVEEYSTGMEGLASAQKAPDLIIVDMKLPDISGYEVCRRIKSDPAIGHTPVLQISASFVSNESKVKALEGGADGYLTHPVDPTVLLATVRALLRLKQAESILRQSAQQWRTTFDALSEGLAILDTWKCVTRCNRAFANLCGLSFGEIIGADGLVLLHRYLGAPSDFLNRDKPYSGEWQHEGRWLHLSVYPVANQEQRFGSIVVVNNIQERKMAEQSLLNSEKLAATGRLAHTIAHEINNPLEAIVNLIFLSQLRAEQPDVRNFLAQAQNELNRVARITKQVLSFHRESNRPVLIDLQDLLSSVLTLYARQMESQQISLQYNRSSSQPLMVLGFPGELRQVIANLLGNAIDATPPHGAITLRLRRRSLNGVAGVSFTILDTGPGIPPEIRDRIFEPFFTTKELKGSGLGLWITKTIVSKHEGKLRFRTSTQPGRSGTCFILFLPDSTALLGSAREGDETEREQYSKITA